MCGHVSWLVEHPPIRPRPMNPHVAWRSRVLEKHLRELWRATDGAICLKGIDTTVNGRIVFVELLGGLRWWANAAR